MPRPPKIDHRPVLSYGDEGPAVAYMQSMLPHGFDGDFGPLTEEDVREFQRTRGLTVTGVVGDETWAALEAQAPPVPPPVPPGALDTPHVLAIMRLAAGSAVASYSWQDRGVAAIGYTQGIAVAFAQTYLKLKAGHPAAVEMAKANTHDDDTDALAWLNSDFVEVGMSNERDGIDTLRHLYVLLMGLGMRESSGRHCEGRDMSADNVTSDTAEAGLYQTSYNAHTCDPQFNNLFDEYLDEDNEATCYLEVFSRDVSCSESDWACYGSGAGYAFQMLCKDCPAFAVESCAITLRNLRQHYGPINRREAEILPAADHMFRAVQVYVDAIPSEAGPEPTA